MAMNGVMAIMSRYFAEFGSFSGQLRKSAWSAINRFSLEKCHKHDGRAVLFAIAELLVWLDMQYLYIQRLFL